MNRRVHQQGARRAVLRQLAGPVAGSVLGAIGIGLSPTSARAQSAPAAVPAPVIEEITPREQREVLGAGAARMALLLPPRNGDYVRIAQALRNGFVAAHQRDGRQVPCEILDVPDRVEDFAKIYREFTERDIKVVVGPLTRNGVNSLVDANAPAITTLALNLPDVDRRLPDYALGFTLAIEGEARQLAKTAYDEAAARIPSRRPLRAAVVYTAGALQKRAALAFVEQWRDLGGEMGQPLEADLRAASSVRAGLLALTPDVVLLSAAVDGVKAFKGHVPKGAQAYATSVSNPQSTTPASKASDLEGVRMTEMPFLVQGDHPAVMTYPKAPRGFTVDLQRVYAFGIDAFRVGAELLTNGSAFEIDGVTGRLRVDQSERFLERTSVLAEVRGGQLVVAEPR